MQARLRSFALVLALGALAPVVACGKSSDPTSASDTRTVASMLPKLTRSLTPAGAEAAFGKPDETVGSGLLIYVYRAEAGKKVYLGFPGFAAILYAKAVDASGGAQDLPLRD
jgi:hypothetical protein